MEWIVTDNISVESWSRLLEYANLDFTHTQVVKFHGEPKSKSECSSYKKQARQIRSCILQSKEYFDAASNSSLVTSPNHLYYGMLSLAQACMLLRGTGEYSLDNLRKKRKIRGHGLSVAFALSESNAAAGVSLLEKTSVEVLDAGSFSTLYQCLPNTEDLYGKVEEKNNNGLSQTLWEKVAYEQFAKPCELLGRKDSLLSMIRYLPDLRNDLRRFGVKVPSSRVNHDLIRVGGVNKKILWRLHGADSADDFDSIVREFSVLGSSEGRFDVRPGSDGKSGVVVFESSKYDSDDSPYSFPLIRTDISSNAYIYSDNVDTSEFVDIYRIAFGLSILGRYYPDIWVTSLESHCISSKIIERFCEIAQKKVPSLALSILTGQQCFITNQRQPWFG